MTDESPGTGVDPALLVRYQAGLRRRRRRIAWVCGLVALVLVLGWVLYFSPLLAVSRVSVRGTSVTTDDQVRQAAQIATGKPLAALDAHAIEQRVSELPAVASCHLVRSWPRTVTLQVSERQLVYQAEDSGAFQWTDHTGAVFNVTPQAQQVPIARLPSDASQSLRANIAAVLEALPPQVRSLVQSVSASSSDNILLQLINDRTVFWGSAEQLPEKAALLPVLLGQQGSNFDISSVSHPAVK